MKNLKRTFVNAICYLNFLIIILSFTNFTYAQCTTQCAGLFNTAAGNGTNASIGLGVVSNSSFGENAGGGSGSGNSCFGAFAGDDITTGNSNSFFGSSAGHENTIGNNNCSFGNGAGYNNNSGEENCFFGKSSGFNTTSSKNSFFGYLTGESNVWGSQNCFFGNEAGSSNTIGGWNSFFGSAAGDNNITGSSNNFFGSSSGNSNTTGKGNCFFGNSAGGLNTTGEFNLFLGLLAGSNNTTGTRNICIGYNAGPTDASNNLDSLLYIDIEESDAPLIYAEFANDFVKINGSFEVAAGLNNPSSKALKQDFQPINANSVLSKISAMPIQSWTYKSRPTEIHIGPVAEDFYAAFGLGQGDKCISTIDANGVALAAIQELKKENDAAQIEINQLNAIIEALAKRISKLEK